MWLVATENIIETSSPSVKEGEGFPARNTWSGQADSESFAQVIKKSERKKRPLETKEGFPAFKGLSNVLHKIDQNNIRLYQGLVMHLNSKTVVGTKSRPTKLVESLDFRPKQIGACSLVVNSTISNLRRASSNPSFSIL